MIKGQKKDLWAHVQPGVWEAQTPSNVKMVDFPRTPTVHIPNDEDWHSEEYRVRADEVLVALEEAVAKGRSGRARRLRRSWLRQVHKDRIAYAREVARERGLRLDPMGRGPLADRPTVLYRDRLPWYIRPVSRYDHERLPDRTGNVIETWNGSGGVFDQLYVADEPALSGRFPTHALIGAVSENGRSAEWFVLDRWAA